MQQHQHPRPNSQNSYYSRTSSQPIKDYSNNSVQSPLALHSTNNHQAPKASLNNKSNSVSAASYNNSNSRAMNSNSKMVNDKHNSSSSATARSSKNVNSNHLKKKIISPEEVIQLFSVPNASAAHHPHHPPAHPHLTGFLGHHSGGRQRTSSGSAIVNENQRGRKSPSSASSPPTMTHQVNILDGVSLKLKLIFGLFLALSGSTWWHCWYGGGGGRHERPSKHESQHTQQHPSAINENYTFETMWEYKGKS